MKARENIELLFRTGAVDDNLARKHAHARRSLKDMIGYHAERDSLGPEYFPRLLGPGAPAVGLMSKRRNPDPFGKGAKPDAVGRDREGTG